MENTKLEISIPPDVQVLCKLFEITPEELLSQFMDDLCSMPGNGGSDERMMAKQYFCRTHLAMHTEFLWRNAQNICDDFETLYQASYPSTDNPKWKEQRKELLKTLQSDWRERMRPMLKR